MTGIAYEVPESALTFEYTLLGDVLTIVDGFGTIDLPLTRIDPEDLPAACFTPP